MSLKEIRMGECELDSLPLDWDQWQVFSFHKMLGIL
jgi:hypothetical protein